MESCKVEMHQWAKCNRLAVLKREAHFSLDPLLKAGIYFFSTSFPAPWVDQDLSRKFSANQHPETVVTICLVGGTSATWKFSPSTLSSFLASLQIPWSVSCFLLLNLSLVTVERVLLLALSQSGARSPLFLFIHTNLSAFWWLVLSSTLQC